MKVGEILLSFASLSLSLHINVYLAKYTLECMVIEMVATERGKDWKDNTNISKEAQQSVCKRGGGKAKAVSSFVDNDTIQLSNRATNDVGGSNSPCPMQTVSRRRGSTKEKGQGHLSDNSG